MPECKLNGKIVEFNPGETILDAAKRAEIDIPTLCHIKGVSTPAACRMCVVEVAGSPRLQAACATALREGMEIETESERVAESRKKTLDLMCKHHRMDCEYCPNYTFCELHGLLRRYGMDDRLYSRVYHERDADESGTCIVRDPSKCVLCRRCVAVCHRQGLDVPGALGRGERTKIGSLPAIADSACVGCGQCVRNCPTGALFVKNDSDEIFRAINRKKCIVFGITRETSKDIGRFFGETEGDNMGKLTALLKKMGTAAVLDASAFETKCAKKAAEILKSADTPRILTRCPAAALTLKDEPGLVKLPTAQEAFQEAVKELKMQDIFTVYVSPCASAKREKACDLVLTTTELYTYLLRACVSRVTLRRVWERTQPEDMTESTEPGFFADLAKLVGWDSVPPVADGIVEAKAFLSRGQVPVMARACPGGCLNGGGQMRPGAYEKGDRQ